MDFSSLSKLGFGVWYYRPEVLQGCREAATDPTIINDIQRFNGSHAAWAMLYSSGGTVGAQITVAKGNDFNCNSIKLKS
eukprot:3036720-Amphidinium_carterae.2